VLQDPPLPWVTADRHILNPAFHFVDKPVTVVTCPWLLVFLQDPLPWVTADKRILNPALCLGSGVLCLHIKEQPLVCNTFVIVLQDPPLHWVNSRHVHLEHHPVTGIDCVVFNENTTPTVGKNTLLFLVVLQDPPLLWVTADRRILNPAQGVPVRQCSLCL
jgi:hypothetical protein